MSDQQSRQAIVDQIVREKFAGDADLANLLPPTDDADALNSEADAMVATMRKYAPNWGGKAVKPSQSLTDAENRFAASLKMPDEQAQPFPGDAPLGLYQGLTSGQLAFAKSLKLAKANATDAKNI